MTLLACIAKDGAKIEPAVCVAEQVEERCFCPKAPIAISEVSTGTPDPRLKHQLPVLSARALAMYRKPPEQRYAGPALRVHNEQVAQSKVQGSDTGGGTGPGAPLVTSPAWHESPAVTSSVAPAVPDTGLSHLPATGCETTTRGTTPVAEPVTVRPEVPSGTEPRVCRIDGCAKELRSDNQSGLCGPHTLEARSISGSRRLGVPRVVFPSSTSSHVAKPKENVVPLKPVESTEETLRLQERVSFNEALGKALDDPRTYGEPVDAGRSLPDPKVLPHAYLLLCVKEARRRIAELDENFTFITAKEA